MFSHHPKLAASVSNLGLCYEMPLAFNLSVIFSFFDVWKANGSCVFGNFKSWKSFLLTGLRIIICAFKFSIVFLVLGLRIWIHC